ncbi:hypothetical protein LZ32DRAFT_674062, partial [Colletotrichum eremochloae]
RFFFSSYGFLHLAQPDGALDSLSRLARAPRPLGRRAGKQAAVAPGCGGFGLLSLLLIEIVEDALDVGAGGRKAAIMHDWESQDPCGRRQSPPQHDPVAKLSRPW